MTEKLIEGIKKLNLELSPDQTAALESYIQKVLEFNLSYNLMKADSADELAVNHILDSLAALPHIKNLIHEICKNKNCQESDILIGDIGSGGGCPGLPLAIALPQVNFVLVERMEKRCVFLQSAINSIKIKNASVNCRQANLIKSKTFDIEVFRAFHPFDKGISLLLLNMLKDGGYLAAYKARSEKIQAEMESVKSIIPQYKKIALTVPFLEDHERNLVIVKK